MTDSEAPGLQAQNAVAETAEEVEDTTYTMTVELSVLESLGINLYSNAAAVLSELVANAYDADAGSVDIAWQPRKPDGESEGEAALQEVVVADDGLGMSQQQINDRFLTAGYKKRDTEGSVSGKWRRPFMGRKGIGKLSVFSLARTVEVYSKVAGEDAHGLRIVVGDLEKKIRTPHSSYHPQPIPVPPEYDRDGTTLVLSDLKSKRSGLTAAALRKRLARRFDVLDQRKPEEGGFRIIVNKKPITWADRQELKHLQFLWEFGAHTLPASALPNDVGRFILPNIYVDKDRDWKISGWIGTTRKPTDLVDDADAGSLKNIIVLARKRPIQEGIIEKLDFSRLFGNYVTGQIEADFLDLDDPEFDDIATSDRQRLIEDDERVIKLQDVLRAAFVTASEQWSKARPKADAKDVLKDYPQLKEWLGKLDDYQKPAAESMVGTIASLKFEKNDEEARRDLLRSGVLAFERIGLRKNSDDLEKLATVTAEELLPLLGRQDNYEAGLWADILRSRVEAISQLKVLTEANEKEKVLQGHLFNHLWLLDPSWERATLSPRMEENIRKFDPNFRATDENGNEITGRVDIRYATVSGRHLIVELKRYGISVDAEDLRDQGLKYVKALASVLEQAGRGEEVDKIEVVFVLGKKPAISKKAPAEKEREYLDRTWAGIHGDYRLYDALIDSAENQYEEYLKASDRARELDELLKTLEAPEGADEGEELDGDGGGAALGDDAGSEPADEQDTTT